MMPTKNYNNFLYLRTIRKVSPGFKEKRDIENLMSNVLRTLYSLRGTIRQRRLLIALCAGLTFVTGPVTAQNKTEVNKEDGKAMVRLNLQDVDIRVLISTVAEVSGRNFIVDPRVKGKINVVSGDTLDPETLYDVFLSILEVHNFATVDSGFVVKVLPSNVIKQRPTPTLFSPTQDTNDAQITQIIQLKFASVQDLVPIIRPLIPPTSHFAPHVPSNSVVITDTAANIQRVLKIINRIDVPDKRSNIRVVNLNFAKASALAATLTQLVATTADPKDAANAAKVSIQPFDAINSLVVSAPDDQFAKIQALIDELDIEREVEGNVNVIVLKHARAEDLASILQDITANTAQGAVSEFSVQADEASNSLIVKASGAQLKTVQDVVDELDKRRAQVYVETIIAEVSLGQTAALGINWSAGGARGATAGTPPDDDGTGGTDGTPGFGNLIDTDRPGRQIDGTASIGQAFTLGDAGFNFSLLDFSKYQLDVIVNAIRSDSNSDVLSTPTILTLDNEQAEIVVGQEVPFITGTFNSGLNVNNNGGGDGGDGGTGGGNNLNTGSGFQTIERRDVGILLRITPQINEGDTIQLEVFQETSSIDLQATNGAADTVTNRRSIEAVVQVDDGQVVVLGGLITEDVNDTVNKIPFLGDLPFLGVLFRNKTKMVEKRNLMIFLKPRIIRSAEQLADYSKIRYDEIRRDEQIIRNQSSDLLIPESEAPVLNEYENSTGDGLLGSEQRVEALKRGEVKKDIKTNIKDIIFGRYRRKQKPDAPQDDFKTDGEMEAIKTEALESLKEGAEAEGLLPEIEEGLE